MNNAMQKKEADSDAFTLVAGELRVHDENHKVLDLYNLFHKLLERRSQSYSEGTHKFILLMIKLL